MTRSYTKRDEVIAARDEFYAEHDKLDHDEGLSGSAWHAFMVVDDTMKEWRAGYLTNGHAAFRIDQQTKRVQGLW